MWEQGLSDHNQNGWRFVDFCSFYRLVIKLTVEFILNDTVRLATLRSAVDFEVVFWMYVTREAVTSFFKGIII